MCKMIQLDQKNTDHEHICCAFSDKKCSAGYQLKKDWLKESFSHGYVFRRLDARAKVFIEYGPAETGWVPVNAPDYLLVNCFWVSGQYKGKGYGKELLGKALEDARSQGKNGLVTVTGTKKFHFMSDAKWLLMQGFKAVEQTASGFSLLVRKTVPDAIDPSFKANVLKGYSTEKNGLTAFYSNRCPYTAYYVNTELRKTAANRNLDLTIVHLTSMEQAQSAPTPATIFSLFLGDRFITTDVSVCLDNRFDKITGKIFGQQL